MTASWIIGMLESSGIPTVIIGGIAMRLHDSSRLTQDLDLSVAATTVDKAVRTLYKEGYVLVCAVTEEAATVCGTVEAAESWIEGTDPGSLTLIRRPQQLLSKPSYDVPHRDIEVESQVDLLYDLAVPFGHLLHDANETEINGVRVRYASDRHLLRLKEARQDKTAADYADIAYLRARIENR
ncbi:MAG: hypothetical protein WD492_09100 [Alkalispirochaeta sp.]